MPVIAVVGNKGGAGKTTLTINLASGLSRSARTAVVDADPQGSSLQWREIADSESAVAVYPAARQLEDQLTALSEEYDYLLIDCPPSVHAPQTSAVLGVGDLALIPVQPSPMDLWATVHIEHAVATARNRNRSLSSLLVINQLEPRTTLSNLVREALTEIALPVAITAIRRRAIYRNCALEGKSVFDIGRRGADAAAEIEQLITEVTAA